MHKKTLVFCNNLVLFWPFTEGEKKVPVQFGLVWYNCYYII